MMNNHNNRYNAVEAARHICQEARVVLTSLRGGPPAVARGEMAQDLMDMRMLVKVHLQTPPPPPAQDEHVGVGAGAADGGGQFPPMSPSRGGNVNAPSSPRSGHHHHSSSYHAPPPLPMTPEGTVATTEGSTTTTATDQQQQLRQPQYQQAYNSDEEDQGAVLVKRQDVTSQQHHHQQQRQQEVLIVPDSPMPTSKLCNLSLESTPKIREIKLDQHHQGGFAGTSGINGMPSSAVYHRSKPMVLGDEIHAGLYARPFLAVIMDPRAAGPHTLVALRSLHRLLEQGSLVAAQPQESTANDTKQQQQQHGFQASLEPLMRAVLACKFEQTDAGADEAVEMAIADLLALLVKLNSSFLTTTTTSEDDASHNSIIHPETLMDAFNTVFVTRNTFVHSPALCYHFEDVLISMVTCIFNNVLQQDESDNDSKTAQLILEFLVNQLLHTPLAGGGNDTIMDASGREAQLAHDATRVLCLRLTRCCLKVGWGNREAPTTKQTTAKGRAEAKVSSSTTDDNKKEEDSTSNDSSDDEEETRSLLTIIKDDLCLSLLMTGQAIWAYHDASSNISPGIISLEVLSEICGTLSTLWNTKALRCHLESQFETMFTGFYQRALALLRKRPNPLDSTSFNANLVFDAEVELILESLVDILCLHTDTHSITRGDGGALETLFSMYDCHMSRSDVASGLIVELCRSCGGNVSEEGKILLDDSLSSSGANTGGANTPVASAPSSGAAIGGDAGNMMVEGSLWRPVPAHLKELCAEALVGGMNCLFNDDTSVAAAAVGEEGSPFIGRMNEVAKMPKLLAPPLGESNSQEEEKEEAGNFVVLPPILTLRETKSKKRLMRTAATMFNTKAKTGIQFLVDSGLIPSPVTPKSVASFLRNALVVGLDKKAVGQYLGEAGKGPVPGKSPPSWERDWFHKEVLTTYCSLFRFERQSLLDGLRMFLASFRLPGEAQMIDRILQAFAESCGRVCDEGPEGPLKLFSPDPKKASDAAYLLSFSIIMLNTDQHNDNIREDRKMSAEDFVKNNTDYGADITEKGHELPADYLVGIYESIREEEIRTEGEGADGHMTVERWKDVLRGPPGETEDESFVLGSKTDANDLKELVLETVWMPILSAIGGLWGAPPIGLEGEGGIQPPGSNPRRNQGGMLGAQGARLGMDMSMAMLDGVRNLGRLDIFHQIFGCICRYTGLLGTYDRDSVDRTWSFVNSVEAQSAVSVAIQVARDAGDALNHEAWKCVWGIIFELRDLKLLSSGVTKKKKGILAESEPDLLSQTSRRDWMMRLVKGSVGDDGGASSTTAKKSFFQALFGSEDKSAARRRTNTEDSIAENPRLPKVQSLHGKEDLILWDDLAPSDDEEESYTEESSDDDVDNTYNAFTSEGAKFESLLIHEDFLVYQEDAPVTGLERIEDTRQFQITPRARVRKRLGRVCDFDGIVSDSRFLDLESIQSQLKALVEILESSASPLGEADEADKKENGKISENVFSRAMASFNNFPISPASEALAEVLICEIAIKNKDRLGVLWTTMLRDHYKNRLEGAMRANQAANSNNEKLAPLSIDPGMEKCVSGLLRICGYAVLREEVANEILGSLQLFYQSEDDTHPSVSFRGLNKHLGEGLWRICRNVDELRQLGVEGWDGLLGLAQWCAFSGGSTLLDASKVHGKPNLDDDDSALQAYRALHLMLHAPELKDVIPFRVVGAIRALVVAGERSHFPKLSCAGLDLLHLLHTRLETLIARAVDPSSNSPPRKSSGENESEIWLTCWGPVLEGMSASAEFSQYPSVRQHALSMLTDAFIDKQGRCIPADHLCKVLQEICIPLAGKQLSSMFQDARAMTSHVEEIMIEFELCISLMFKPFLHHLKRIVSADADLLSVWTGILKVLENLLRADDSLKVSPENDPGPATIKKARKILFTSRELASEHLRNAITVLIASGILKGKPESPHDLSALTWASIDKMSFCKDAVEEWKKSAMLPAPEQEEIEDAVLLTDTETAMSGQEEQKTNVEDGVLLTDTETTMSGQEEQKTNEEESGVAQEV